ncbi:hypothetical protein CF98_02515 [Halopseudomonas bauzanensis]|nr:hypothetical protein CF98_02515 [Halopseudomonas bauzanensis]
MHLLTGSNQYAVDSSAYHGGDLGAGAHGGFYPSGDTDLITATAANRDDIDTGCLDLSCRQGDNTFKGFVNVILIITMAIFIVMSVLIIVDACMSE